MVRNLLPRVDVIMAVRNGLPFVKDAVSSALEQDGVRTRVIFIDNGSTDNTVDEINSLCSPNVQIYSGSKNDSAAAARNYGVTLSSANWLSFLDGDDLWPKNRTKKLFEVIEKNNEAISLGHVVEFQNKIPALENSVHFDASAKPAFCVGGTLFSRDIFELVGPLSEELRVGEYVDWLSRSRDIGIEEIIVPVISLYRRKHNNNTSTARRNDYSRDIFRLVREHQQRVKSLKSE